MLSSFVGGFLYLLTYMDFKNLMCGSRNLIESLMQGNETPMCIISGIYNSNYLGIEQYKVFCYAVRCNLNRVAA